MNYYLGAWKKYVTFSGRARRKEYWMFVLFNVIAAVIVNIIDGVLVTTFLSTIYGLAVLLPSLAILSRRLHDTDRSAWWIFICLIPIIGEIVLIVFAVFDSQPGQNKYGPNPKEGVPTSQPAQ